MQEFLKFYDQIKNKRKWRLEIYHTSIVDWVISIETMDSQNAIISVQNCDMELAFAKAQVSLKEWLLDNEGGY